MALIGNYSVLNKTPGRWLAGGGAAHASGVGSAQPLMRSNFNALGAMRNVHYPDGSSSALKLVGYPDGGYEGVSRMLPYTAGALTSYNEVTGTGDSTATAWAVKLADAGLTGSGDLTAVGSLIVQLLASISGDGTVSAANLQAFLQAIASLSGTGEASGTLVAFGELLAAVIGSGTADASILTGTGELIADIVSYGDLTPEGIRDAIWNATAADFNTSGTMGQKLNSAASGGIDYDALADAVWNALASTHNVGGSMGELLNNSGGAPSAADIWAYASRTLTANPGPTAATIASAVMTYAVETGWTMEEMLRITTAVLAGKVSGAGTGTEVFRDINDTKNRVTATVDSSGNRSAITLDPS